MWDGENRTAPHHRRYTLKIMYEFPREYKILIPLFLIILTYLSLPPYSIPRGWILPLVCIFLWIKVLTIPFKVTFADDNKIIFRSLLKKTIVHPNEIIKIVDSLVTFKVVTNKGRIEISTLMKTPYELKRRIENFNEEIDSEDILQKNMEKAEKKHPLTILLWIALLIAISLYLKLYRTF